MKNLIALAALTALYSVFAFTLAINATSFNHSLRTRQDPPEAARIVRMKVTAYCLCKTCCGKWADKPASKRRTAGGRNPFVPDGVASDPAVLPYGTKLWIPGIGERIVDDRFADRIIEEDAKAGVTHIDLRVVIRDEKGKVNLPASHREASRWEVQWLEVEILPNERRQR